MDDLFDLRGCHALVTGAGQGVGRQVALTLAEHNAGTIVVNDLFSERAEAVAAEIVAVGGRALAVAADVTDRSSVDMMVQSVARLDGPVQILVNNAGLPPGLFQMRPFAETTVEEWEPIIRLNLYGVLYMSRAFINPMVDAGWGRVITIISEASRAGDPFVAVYAAAKAAAAGFSRSLASEVGKLGVNVNCVSLATVLPEGTRPSEVFEDLGRRVKSYALRRLGSPKDVAPMVLFLASDASSWITGQVYPVNGGYSYAL
ncbi:MAG: SDR family NAD(P)-dependent oxidoreductase [Acidimicrobiales bacterium]